MARPQPKDFKALVAEASERLGRTTDRAKLEVLRTEYLGRKGKLTKALREISKLSDAAKQKAGKAGNAAKRELDERFRDALAGSGSGAETGPVDVTLPGAAPKLGHIHPVSQVISDIENIFTGLGFDVVEGPEIEDDWHNFEALNMGPDHPAR